MNTKTRRHQLPIRIPLIMVGLSIAVLVFLGVIGASQHQTSPSSSRKAPLVTKKTPENYANQIANIYNSDSVESPRDISGIMLNDSNNLTLKGASTVIADGQMYLQKLQTIQNTLNYMSVPQDFKTFHAHYLAETILVSKGINLLLNGIRGNTISDITAAKDAFTQSDNEGNQADTLLFAAEKTQNGTFATTIYDFNGITVKNNFDVPLDCSYVMDASGLNWSNGWSYQYDVISDTSIIGETTHFSVPSHGQTLLQWANILDPNYEVFNYPSKQSYDTQLNCSMFDKAQTETVSSKLQ